MDPFLAALIQAQVSSEQQQLASMTAAAAEQRRRQEHLLLSVHAHHGQERNLMKIPRALPLWAFVATCAFEVRSIPPCPPLESYVALA